MSISNKAASTMTDEELRILLRLRKGGLSKYNNRRKRDLINAIIIASGIGTEDPDVQRILDSVQTYEDAQKITEILVDAYTYKEVYVEFPDDSAVNEYVGADAPLELAQLEFSKNLMGSYATEAEKIAVFVKQNYASNKWELPTEAFNAYVQQAVSAKSRQEFLAGVHSGEYNQAMNIYDAVHIPIKDMIKCVGYTQAGFAKEYMIPIRTVEDWCSGKNTPTTYLKLLLAEKLGILNIKRTEAAK